MHRFPRRRAFRTRRRLPSALLPLLAIAALSGGFFRYLSAQLTPLVSTMAVSKTVNLISLAISEETDFSLADEQLSYQDFVDVQTGATGQVTALSFKTAESTSYKHRVVAGLIERIEQIDPDELAIPMGNLSGILLLSALGPSIRVHIQSVGDITAEYDNEFVSAGVNQTKHSVYLDVSVTVYLLIPGEVIPVTVNEKVCIAETVIVGEVPGTYLNLQDGAN